MSTRPSTFAKIFEIPFPVNCPVCGNALETIDRPRFVSYPGRKHLASFYVPKHMCARCGIFVVLHRATFAKAPSRVHDEHDRKHFEVEARRFNRRLKKLLSEPAQRRKR